MGWLLKGYRLHIWYCWCHVVFSKVILLLFLLLWSFVNAVSSQRGPHTSVSSLWSWGQTEFLERCSTKWILYQGMSGGCRSYAMKCSDRCGTRGEGDMIFPYSLQECCKISCFTRLLCCLDVFLFFLICIMNLRCMAGTVGNGYDLACQLPSSDSTECLDIFKDALRTS